MRAQSLMFLAAALAGAVLSAGSPVAGSDRDGKLLVHELQGTDAKARLQAAQALGELGPLARPAVGELIKTLHVKELPLRHEAVIALGRIGPGAARAVPELTDLAQSGPSPILQHAALDSLRKIGKGARPSVPVVKRQLTSRDPYQSLAAAWALLVLAPDDPSCTQHAIPLLIKLLDSRDKELRHEATIALADSGEHGLNALNRLLESGEARQRIATCEVLSAMGPIARSATPHLVKLLHEKEPPVLLAAVRAVGAIHAQPKLALPALEELMRDSAAEIRSEAATAVGEFGDGAGPTAVARLAEMLKDREPRVRQYAAKALGAIGPSAATSVEALGVALNDEQVAVALAATDALGRIGSGAVPALVQGLSRESLRSVVLLELGHLGAEARSAVPALTLLLKDANAETRQESILALAAIGRAAAPAAEDLMTILKSPKSPDRLAAAYALARVGATQAVLPLQEQLRETKDETFATACAWALAVLHPADPTVIKLAVPHLTAALSHNDADVRRQAAEGLGRIGQPAAAAVPALITALNDAAPQVRSEAATALGEMYRVSQSAVPHLITLVDQEDPDAASSAMYALGRIGHSAATGEPALRSRLSVDDPRERMLATWAMARILPTAEHTHAAETLLLRTLKAAGHPEMRAEAASLLGFLDANETVRTALQQARDDRDETVREAAESALQELGSK